jgi:hypothetical protein
MRVFTAMDVTGYTQRGEEAVWVDRRGVILSIHYFDVVPDLPARLGQVEALRRGLAPWYAAQGGGLIEATVAEVDGQSAVRQLLKVRLPGREAGLAFLGSYTVPKAECSAVVKVQAAEGATTGVREAFVLDRVGVDGFYQPHPYAPDLAEGLPYHVADAPEWDRTFPEHPLTWVRAEVDRIVQTVRFHPDFRSLPPFPGPR